MPDEIWADYLDKLRELKAAIKLTVFWTLETAKFTRETCDQCDIVIKGSRKFVNQPKVELETVLKPISVTPQSLNRGLE